MTTYYNGTYINWLDGGIFKIERKKFRSLRGAMDYIDKRRKSARGNNNLDTSHSDGHTGSVVHKSLDKQPGHGLAPGNTSNMPSVRQTLKHTCSHCGSDIGTMTLHEHVEIHKGLGV